MAGECKDGVCPVPWANAVVMDEFQPTEESLRAMPHLQATYQEGCPLVVEDVVNHPSHYTDGGIECIEALEAQLTHEEYRGYLKGCIAKYIWRERHKGQLESLKKAQWYLNRLIELEDVD